MFQDTYRNKTVFLTGHTGFKGSWLAYWLRQLGATVVGYSLPAPTVPSHHALLGLGQAETLANLNDLGTLTQAMQAAQPDIVFHMAAQPLVRESYRTPLETLETNVLGTARLLEAVRQTSSVRAVVIVTSDKCYENPEDGRPLRETDPMGGFDPYSVSKGAAELITASYRNSFFNLAQYGQTHHVLVASVRAGNVIGGGDWATDRLIPDLIRSTQEGALGSAAPGNGQPVEIRNPLAVRPWQHVLEPLSGYLLVGQQLMAGDLTAAEGWNFGPDVADVLPVRDVVREAKATWSAIQCHEYPSDANPHEAHLLSLNCTKAHEKLGWKPVWNTQTAILRSIAWYRDYYQNGAVHTDADLRAYVAEAEAANLPWTV
ncbi:CDP-glucose 4,6-dehydratase [Fibrella sp. HMF5335]|uniref:CDP-glucose 4,6-dehydratase n=1 Tax=Fibrella rubiginis TaxID=2817060 RepID=A0A939GI48_9BACT|nr:CDP-glucose 4,6-dehydratase [Fibrella rubiginis]MBO0937895.1 CDP-glucose 4,6-dehydratase [Fibrella rubiginis]